ncbi:MAG: hypothetical protein O2U61_05825 [Candidatus Bathyarchaeota archaeon]|nr:hypothetical protein [Candidatus Bathyarchaeota archaeon]
MKQKLIGNNIMKKLTMDKSKIVNLLKKHSLTFVTLILFIILIFDLIFIYNKIKTEKIDESIITARQEKISKEEYDDVINKNEAKKQTDLTKINQLKNPY